MPLPDMPLPDMPLPDMPLPDMPVPDMPVSDKSLPDKPAYFDQQTIDQGAADQPTWADQAFLDLGVAIPGNWVTITGKTFTMGSATTPSPEPCRNTNETSHLVTLTRKYEIQTTEVTQLQFQYVMGYNPSHFGPGDAGPNCGLSCPVEMVTWHEAAAYCNALSARATKIPCYTCSGSGKGITCKEATGYAGKQLYTCTGYRLPMEAEWEHAYRAGTSSAYYSGKNSGGLCSSCTTKEANAHSIGWYCYNASSMTHPVGIKQKNAWGLYDMAGNLWEWCQDWYKDDLGTTKVTDPIGGGTTDRVLRGGAWNVFPDAIRAAARHHRTPDTRTQFIGFRCVRTTN